MTTCWDWLVIILAVGFVSMIEICVLSICVGKVLDERLKTKLNVEYKIFKAEMDELKVFMKECVQMFLPNDKKMSDCNRTTFKEYNDYEVVKPIPVKRDPELDLKDDVKNWIL